MASTHTNISQWCALVTQLAANLREVCVSDAEVSDEAIINRILAGLLPEFSSIKLQVSRDLTRGSMSLLQCKKELIDYAATEGLKDLSKGGPQSGRNNTFTVDDNNKRRKTGKGKDGGGALEGPLYRASRTALPSLGGTAASLRVSAHSLRSTASFTILAKINHTTRG